MNEQAIIDSYNLFVQSGYKKSLQEFKQLLASNPEAVNDSYGLFQQNGYRKSLDEYKSLMGIGASVETPIAEEPKKKGVMASPFVDGGLEPTKFDPRTGQVVQETPAFAQKQPEVTVPKQKLPERTEFQFQPGKPLPAQKAAPLPKFVEDQLTAVTPDLIGKTEENVVPQLKYQFGPLGFKFEETGAGDYMIATSPSGESIEVSLDITDIDGKKAEANKLNAFLRKGATTVKNISTLQKQYVDANKKITSQKELDDSLASINAEEANIMAKNTEFAKLQTSLESERARLESVPPQQRNNPEYIARVNDFISRADQFSNEFQTFVKDAQDLDKRGQQLNKSIGKYTEMKAQQGTWYGAGLNAVFNKSIYDIAKGVAGLAVDFMGEVIPATGLPIMSQEDYEKNFIEQARKEGIDVPEGEDFVSLTSRLDSETIANIENRVIDVGKKIVKGEVIGSLDKASNMAMESSGVSPEYYRSIEETFVGGSLLGAGKSILPALTGNPILRTVLMSSQVLAGLDAEMANDPAFADVSENEKLLVKAPIAVAVGILENLGLSNLLKQKGFLNGLVLKALGKVGTGASYKTFGEVIKNEIDSAVGRGALTLGAGFLAEAETGALQEVVDIGAKSIYNKAKEKEMFDTPDSVVQFIEQVGKAGLQEGIGAGVLAVPGSVSAAYRDKGFLGMDDAQFSMFEKMANDSNIEKGFVARLKSRINAGEITASEGKEILDNYNNSVSLFNSLPDNLDMQGKKEAMNLLKEKRDLENQIAGKDQALTTPQRNRVTQINEQLTKLSEDAIQKQAAGEVPVQPGTGVGQEVAQGEPKAEPQVTSEAGVQEEVVTPILNQDIEVKSSEGRKGLVPVSELEEFIGEDRLGEAQMPTSRATIDRLKEDIAKNGFKEPIVLVYDRLSGEGEATIIEGNHRIIAAKELGLKEVPVIFEKGTIRTNESRVKNNMFPIKRKTIGEIDDTRGITGSDLGLTVRQPTDADFVKQVQEEVAPTVELTDAQIVEYNPTEEVADKNNEVLFKVIQSKKVIPQAEPQITDFGDSVMFEFNNMDDDGRADKPNTWTRLTFKKKKDGTITGAGVKIERKAGNIRNTQFFKNYIESKRAELAAQPSAVDTKYTKENLPALNVELQRLFKKQNRLQKQFEKTEDPVVEAELDKTNEELTFLSTKIEELESSVTPEVAAQPKAATKPLVSKKKNREEIISRPAFTPITLARQWLLSGGKLRSIQSEENKMRGVGVGKGVREETGMGGVEMRQFIGVIDNKRGLSPEVAAERIYENLNEELQASMDVQEIRDAIIEVVSSEDRKTWIENQDRETSEREDFDEYDQWMYSQLTDQERADFDEYQQRESYFDYLNQNAKQLAKEYDAYIKSQTYQDYIEEIYGREREGQDNAQDQNDGRGKEQGTDGEKITVQTKEQVESDLNELLKLNPKEKSTGQKALDYLDSLLKDYDKIERGGIGMNIALPTIKKIIQGIRALVKAGMALNDAIKKVAKDNNVSVEDVINGIDEIGKQRKKSAPSAAKILGKPRKKITVDEMAALKDQIRLEARAARQAKGDLNKKREALAARIIAARRNGYITAAQARTIVNRINRVNLDNPIMVDRLIEYTDKVFDNANYAADMAELRKLQKQARSKNHTSMKDFVDRFTSINPELIPLDRIQDYKEALDFLNNRTPSYARLNDMLPEVESYQVSEEFDAAKTFDALMDKYQSIALNQVGSVEEYVNLIKDINSFKRKAFQLLQNEAIEQEEYDNLIEMVGKDQQTIEENYKDEITKIKKDLIAEIKNQRPKTNPEFTKEENDLIKEYLELSDSDLQSLSPEDLFVLNDLLENVSNGEVDYYRLKDVVSKAANNKAGIEVGKQLKASKISLGSAELRKKMAQFESSFWEGLLGLGRATSGPLQKFIISPFNRAIGSFEKFLRDGYNDFLKLKKKYNIKDKQMNKIGMLTTYLQEYMAQFDPKNKGVKDIGNRDWFKQILDSETMRDDYSPEELKIIEEIHESLPKDSNGNVSPEAVYNSYMANDGRFFTKEEKGFFDSIMDWKKENSTSKQKAANEMSGNAFKEIPFHMLRSRYAGQTAQITPTASGDNGMVRIKAGTGKERASEAVGAINTNFEKLFIKGLEQTGRDYFLSKTLKDINNVLASAKKELDGDKDPLVKAISYTLSDALSYEFSDTASQNLLKRLVQARAAMTLFDPIRAGVEFTSTLLSFGLRARTLSGYKNLFGSQGDMKNLLDFTDSPLRLRQNINNAIDINDGRIEPQGMLTKWTTFLSGLPERTMMVTSWMPTFTSEFQRITGEKFDMKKFNDSEAYREKYGKAIKESSAVADAQTEKIIGPTTKAGQRREIIIFPGKTVGRDTVSGQIIGFFSNYPYREVTEFVNGFREAGEVLKKGDSAEAISQLQKPLGIALNVAAYGFLSSVVYASRLILLGDDEEEKRGSKLLEELMTAKGFIEETAANAAALAASKYAGGGRATLQVLGTLAIALTDNEEQKATIKKMLKGSVYVDPLPTQKLSGYGTADKVNTAILKYIPQFVVLSNIIIDGIGGLNEFKSIYEKIEKKGVDALTKDEELRVLALSVVFTATQLLLNYRGTSLPSYNNLKAGMKAVKEDAGVADIAAGKVPAKKSSGGGGGSRGGGMNKTDMKKYNRELYDQMYGPGSAGYEIEQEIKAFEKEQREYKNRIKDQVYGGKD